MQPLHYQALTESRTTTCLLVLSTLPILAFYLAMLTGMFGLGEPFGVFKLADAAVFFGAPAAIVVLGFIWCRRAMRHRVHPIVIVLVLAWFGLVAAGAVQETLSYLREPWSV
jgi:hypothetical protein